MLTALLIVPRAVQLLCSSYMRTKCLTPIHQTGKAMLICCHSPALRPLWLHTELLGSCYGIGGKAVTFYTFLTLEAAAHGAELLPSVPQLWALSQPVCSDQLQKCCSTPLTSHVV